MDNDLDRGERSLPNGAVAYREVIDNVGMLVADHHFPEDLPVPSCPEWTVRDLVGHLVGVCSFAVGRIAGLAETGRSSAGTGVAGLLDEWTRLGEQAEHLLAAQSGRRGSLMVMDAFTHELDLRYALGAPLPDDHPAFPRAFEILLNGFSTEVAAHNLPAVLISVDGRQWQAGIGEPLATLSGDRYDIYRSLAGRRTHEQITGLGWSRDSHRWLPAFTWGPFAPPGHVVENPVADFLVPAWSRRQAARPLPFVRPGAPERGPM